MLSVICCLSFFVPFLGLLNVLQHLKAERLPLDSKLYSRMISSDNSFFDHVTIRRLYRTNNAIEPTDSTPPDYTSYTLVSLPTAFRFFIALMVLHGLANLIAKALLSKQFKVAGWATKVQHCIELR